MGHDLGPAAKHFRHVASQIIGRLLNRARRVWAFDDDGARVDGETVLGGGWSRGSQQQTGQQDAMAHGNSPCYPLCGGVVSGNRLAACQRTRKTPEGGTTIE